MGAGGIVAEGVYNSNVLLVETERHMMACAQEVIVVADHTKFGRLSLSKLCDLGAIDVVVADPAIPNDFRPLLEGSGVNLHLATPDDEPSGQPRLNGAARIEL